MRTPAHQPALNCNTLSTVCPGAWMSSCWISAGVNARSAPHSSSSSSSSNRGQLHKGRRRAPSHQVNAGLPRVSRRSSKASVSGVGKRQKSSRNNHAGACQRARSASSVASSVNARPRLCARRWQKSLGLRAAPLSGNQYTWHPAGACNAHSASNALLPLPPGAQSNLTLAGAASKGSARRGRSRWWADSRGMNPGRSRQRVMAVIAASCVLIVMQPDAYPSPVVGGC